MIKFLLTFLITSTAFGALTELDKAYVFNKNLLVNGGWESGKASWVASGGTYATTTTSPIIGLAHATWDSSGASQSLSSSAVAIPVGMRGRNGAASCLSTTPSGTATHLFQAYDGTNILASASIVSSAAPARNVVNFVFPSSGNITVRFLSVAADEPSISTDDCYIGPAEGFNLGLAPPQDVFSARISNTDVVSSENEDWINGNCTDATTGEQTCTFKTGIFSTAPNCSCVVEEGGTGLNCQVSSVSATTVLLLSKNDALAASDRNTVLSCQKTGVDAVQAAYRPETFGWKVDANISGANPGLGTASISAYEEIIDAGLTMTQNAGSLGVQIPCSTTNASSGLTCSAGSESIGVVFNIPAAGDVLACASFGAELSTGAGGAWDGTFQIVETPNNAQTISQEGKSRIPAQNRVASTTVNQPMRVCGNFTFTSSGQKTLRLMREVVVSGTVSSAIVLADASVTQGQRDIHWEVYPINQNVPAPVLVNGVVSAAKKSVRICSAYVVNTGTASVSSSDDDCLSFVSDNANGDSTFAFAANIFSATPRCVCSAYDDFSSNLSCYIKTTTAISTTRVRVQTATAVGGGTASDLDFFLFCWGPS